MKRQQKITARAIVASSIFVVSVVLAATAQDLKSPDGIAFAEFKGYDAWQVIAPSQTDAPHGCSVGQCVKAIVGNPVMIKAYKDGIPANGKPVPDGAMIAKIEWAKAADPASPYVVTVPGALNDISFMVKDSKRFKETDGWGYAQFVYNTATATFKANGSAPPFAKTSCHPCHVSGATKARDFVFTKFAPR